MSLHKITTLPLFISMVLFFTDPDRITFFHDTIQVRKKIQAETDTTRLNRLIRQAWDSLGKASGQPKVKVYMQEAYDLVKEKNLQAPYSLHWVNAEFLFIRKDYYKSYLEAQEAMKLLKMTDRYEDFARVNLLNAKCLTFMGSFSEAIDQYNFLETFAKEKQLAGILPDVYRGLADIYLMLNKPDKVDIYNKLLYDVSVAEKNQEYTARALFRLAESSLRDSNVNQSTRYYKESLKIRMEKGDSSLFPLILNRIGWNYYLAKQFDSSIDYFTQSIMVGEKLNSYANLANAYGNIGTIYRDKKEYKKALYNYGKSTAYSLSNKDWFNLSWLYNDMSSMYVSLGDYKKAYECAVLYKQYADSLSNQRYNIGLGDARTKYETDAKEKELEFLALKYEKQQYLVYGFAGFFFLVVVIGFLLFRQSRLTSRRKITEMNHRISEITQANLRQQMNPHFIFNTLNSIQYYMYQHDKISTNNYLTKFSSLMRKTLENSQHTSIPIKDEMDALQLYLELEMLRFKEKFDYSIFVDEEIDTLLYKIPTMLIQPYVENAICHGLINREGKGKLGIELLFRKDHLLCIIQDDGIGREAAMKIRQEKEQNHNSLGTKITESRLDLANSIYGMQMKVQYTDLMDEQGKAAGTRNSLPFGPSARSVSGLPSPRHPGIH